MRIAGVIIAGGRSSRMGQEKAFVNLNGKTLLHHVVRRITPQVNFTVINANGDPARFREFDLPVIADLPNDVATPLAGLRAALRFARDQDFDAVLTAPSDAPFLPFDLVERLATTGSRAALASSAGQAHFLTGLWSCNLLGELEMAMDETRTTRVKDWAATSRAVIVDWTAEPINPFFNINTPEDLAVATQFAAEFKS